MGVWPVEAIKDAGGLWKEFMPKSALKTSLHTLTASFADSVMDAIRSASLEELLGEAHGDSTRPMNAPRALKDARAPSSVRPVRRVSALPTRLGGLLPARPLRSGAPFAIAERPISSMAAEITDPQGLLAMGVAGGIGLVETRAQQADGLAGTAEPTRAAPSVRLRANETLARVSSAGVVIRRGK